VVRDLGGMEPPLRRPVRVDHRADLAAWKCALYGSCRLRRCPEFKTVNRFLSLSNLLRSVWLAVGLFVAVTFLDVVHGR
jgi:hypothetical protein